VFFALFEIGRRLIQLLLEMLGLVLSFLGLIEGALRYLLGLLEPFFEISFLSRSLSQGSSGGNWARKVKSEKVTA
jgi:hypothetical protein